MQLTRTHLLINRFRRQFFSHVKIARIGLIILALFIVVGFVFLFRPPLVQFSTFIKQFTGSGLVQHQGRTNFLLMGMGGGAHEGFDLTDSMIFVSANRNGKSISLITLPRDIWVTSLRAKINTAYHYGYEKAGTEGGILLAKSAVSEIINQPVDYVVILDFSTFSQVIDMIGGVDIVVDRSFDDYRYPIAGRENELCGGDPETLCRYEHLQFVSGPQHLDGTTALKFVRSRYSTDEIEGSDFGRSKRQEKIFIAFTQKLLAPSTFYRPSIYGNLFKLISTSAISDLKPSQYFDLISFVWTFKNSKPITARITEPDQLTNPPISPRYDNQWVLVAKDNDPEVIYNYVAKILGTP